MIPILYSENETKFETNGIGILSDAIDCTVDVELNGVCELELRYPITGIHFQAITKRAIILAKVDPVSQPQPFRIYRIKKTMGGTVNVYARHVAYDAMGIPVAPFAVVNAKSALQGLSDNAATKCPFTFWTDKTTVATMTVSVPTALWSLLGGNKGGILDTYGGEYEFDRWTIKLHNHRGADRGVHIRYGKNLTSLEQDENIANCYTGVYPYWSNIAGKYVQLPEKIVTAQGSFGYSKVIPLDLSAEWREAPTEEQLRARTEKYIQDNNIGKPNVSWKVEFVALEQTEEYKDTKLLEQVLLGDTVTTIFPELNVNVSARAVAGRYKPLLERYENVTLGTVKANIADTIAHQGQSIQQKPSIGMVQSMSEQTAERAVSEQTQEDIFKKLTDNGRIKGLFCRDDVWVFNADVGQIINLFADVITAGVLRSKDGGVYIDLDNGIGNLPRGVSVTLTTWDDDYGNFSKDVDTVIDGFLIEQIQNMRENTIRDFALKLFSGQKYPEAARLTIFTYRKYSGPLAASISFEWTDGARSHKTATEKAAGWTITAMEWL